MNVFKMLMKLLNYGKDSHFVVPMILTILLLLCTIC